jgi:hypothetical protein
MPKVISTPRKFVILVGAEVLDGLLELSGKPELELTLDDCYQSALNPDYYIAELIDTLVDEEREISTIYLLSGAIALHEEDTSGVFIDADDVDKVNDVFGYNGGGASLLYSLLSGSERVELLRSVAEKMHPLLRADELFVRTMTIGETDPSEFGMGMFDEEWEPLEEFFDTFSDDTIELRSVDGMKLNTFGSLQEEMVTVMAMTGMQCYIFNLDKELGKEANKEDEDDIEILGLGTQVKFDPETGEIIEDVPLLPAPRPQDMLLEQYQRGLITKEEYDTRVLIIPNAIQSAKNREKNPKKKLNTLANPYHNFGDKDAKEIKNELREAWQNFGKEDEFYDYD